MPRIYYAADSIVAQKNIFTYPETGIGQMLPLYLKRTVRIQNHAENGRSTKSFIDESRLAAIYNDIREGDFLFIQFGHNDEKQADPNRYTEAYGDYQVNLEKFINVARNRNAYPILITPLCRRQFDENGNLQETHGEYPEAMLQLAKRLDVPFIDLCSLSFEVVSNAGDEASKKWFMNFPAGEYPNYPEGKEDNTHLRPEGATLFAGVIAEELKKLGGIYADLLIDPPAKPQTTVVEP